MFRSDSFCVSLLSRVVVEAVGGFIEFDFSDGAPNVIGWSDLHDEEGSEKENKRMEKYN